MARKRNKKTICKSSSTSTASAPLDKAKCNRVFEFFEKVLRHSKGALANEPFTLLPWQKYVLGELFGRLTPNGLRQYRSAYIELPKKQGKSTTLAGIALYMLVADNEPGSECYGAACDREQAGIIYREMASMVRASPALSKMLEVIDSRKTILYKAKNSFYRVLSADGFRAEGLNIHSLCFDELHSQRDRRLFDSLRYGGAARRQPLSISISTAGELNENALWWEQHCYAERCIADPTLDPSFFGCIYAADRKDDWTDPKVWAKANPSLGKTITEESFAIDCREAQNSPSKLNSFLRYRLNIPTTADVRWLSPDQWAACGSGPPEPLEGRDFWAGLDLGSTQDTTCFCAVFPDTEGGFDVVPMFWLPAKNAEAAAQTTRVPLMQWHREGLLTLTEGSSTDYRKVKADIELFCSKHRCRRIAVDRWNATMLATELADIGLPISLFGQGYASMSSPTKHAHALVTDCKLRHAGHALLSWQAGNCGYAEDDAGNKKLSKHKSISKIDGMVAMVMAIGVHMGESTKPVDLPEVTFF